MFCHAVLRSGFPISTFLESPFVKDFLGTRHAEYGKLQTADHLAKTQVETAYGRDLGGLKERVKARFYYLQADETSSRDGEAVLHVDLRSIDVLSPMPTVETALLRSRTLTGRCDAIAVVTEINSVVMEVGLEKVVLRSLSIPPDPPFSAASWVAAPTRPPTSSWPLTSSKASGSPVS